MVATARMLLGCTLVSRGTAGVIVETEAYHEQEPACHAYRGCTERTRPLFGDPGTAYVYFTYGMHWCFNVVCEEAGVGAAVLIRAVVPTHGLELMRPRRERSRPLEATELCSGPARLVQAMDIRSEDNGRRVVFDPADARPSSIDELLEDPHAVAVVDDPAVRALAGLPKQPRVAIGPRIGISVATELPWRFGIAGNAHLSKRFPAGDHA